MDGKYWQINEPSFTSRAAYLFNSSIHSDSEFLVENETFRCHKLILAMSSPVFEAMFFGSLPESDSVTLKDVKPDIFRSLLRHVYGTQLPFNSVEEACDLFAQARKYLILFVEKKCMDYLMDNVTEVNALYLLNFARLYGEGDLERTCLQEIVCDCDSVLAQESLIDADETVLHSILDMNELNVESEVHVFRAVSKWLKHRKDLNPKFQRKMVRKVRFLSFTLDEYMAEVAPSDLLTDQEKLEILMRLVKTGLPDAGNDLCTERCKRHICASVTTVGLRFQVFLQINNLAEGEYDEQLLVQVSLANERRSIIAEGRLCRAVPYNSHKKILFRVAPTLKPFTEYSIHVHMLQKGAYMFGFHTSLECKILEREEDKEGNGDENEVEKVPISFINHVSNSFPANCTNLFALILTEPTTIASTQDMDDNSDLNSYDYDS